MQSSPFIRRLADAHAAVLVVELAGRVFDSMPETVIEEAEAIGLPLVGLADEIPFVETSAQVHEVLVGMRVKQLIAEEATSQAFMDLLLADEDYVGVVRELARRTGHPVVLEDVAHQMLAYGGATAKADRVVDEWSAHSRAIHERHPSVSAQGPGVPTASAASFREVAPCARQPVVLRGESWGWLHLLHEGQRPSPPELRTLERAAAAVAISLLSERERRPRVPAPDGAAQPAAARRHHGRAVRDPRPGARPGSARTGPGRRHGLGGGRGAHQGQPPSPPPAGGGLAGRRGRRPHIDPVRPHTAVNRRTLRQIMAVGLEDVLHFGRTVSGYEADEDGVRLLFEDGSSATGDVLVAADGINSVVRGQLLPEVPVVDTGLRGPYAIARSPTRWRRPCPTGSSTGSPWPGPRTGPCSWPASTSRAGRSPRPWPSWRPARPWTPWDRM
ncbi:PucR family transcriptional regulator ligand-binding domain-containing protein [Streptomyces europaeiscabiei]|uniref:PucR family transcriptional regulator ligand-binding domain-containing protein n=1 Tax=Streptomyces europaeiscabiei TaxID=146819 RepID=A0AAJ2PJ80_9ACTN|nr:PucR family transcriptional regulator ligand-binding domain-containing protein [Streptomyces europaeiscabiei]MDX3128568.1 PucR family transcriptional regulator ligand-binding domain-containing protein [Streptomyces europaeiscabiei]